MLCGVKKALYRGTAHAHQGKPIFHCFGGRNLTGTVATGLLLELGHASSVEEVEQKTKEVRSIINIKLEMKQVLKRLYV